MEYIKALVMDGLICVASQILINRTKLTPVRILVIFATLGVILTAVGLYEPLAQFAGAGATMPLSGLGYAMAKETEEAVREYGLPGALMDGVTSSAVGIVAVVFFGYLAVLIARPGNKS